MPEHGLRDAPVADMPSTNGVVFPMARVSPFDPPPEYAELQGVAPVVRASMTSGKGRDVWLVTRYAEARAVLADVRFSSDSRRDGYPLIREFTTLIRMDPPDHTRFRRMLAAEFSQVRIEQMRFQVERVADALLDVVEQSPQPVDLVRAFAMPLPSLVICRLLGVPDDDTGFLVDRTSVALDKRSSPEDVERAIAELGDLVERVVDARERDPSDDLVSRFLRDRVRTGECTREDAVDLARLLLVAGHVTTVNMIGLAVLTLLLHPGRERLRADPALIPPTVDELLRLHTITGAVARVATEDVRLGDTVIRSGDGVMVLLSAANRDPRRFPAPDEFRVPEQPVQHLAFGHGPHVCLGLHLARLELEVALSRLLSRMPDMEFACSVDEIPFRHDVRIYGVHELPVRWRGGDR